MGRLAALVCVAATALGCGEDAGGGAGMGAEAGEWTGIYNDILQPSCAADICHGAMAGKLNMSSKDAAHANMVNVAAMGDGCKDMGLVRVIPHDSANSLLITKLAATTPCPSRMPAGGMLADAEVARIASWIDSGAPNN